MLYTLSGFVHVATAGDYWGHKFEPQIHQSRMREDELRKSERIRRHTANRQL